MDLLSSPASGILGAAAVRENFASFDVPLWAWALLVGVITVMLLVDLLVVHRTPHVISFKEAAIESAVWVTFGLGFILVMLWWQGGQPALEYLSGYLIEKSLSVDNVFVWAVIFSYFAVPPKYQFRVLFWGVFGALVMRAIFIFAGVALIEAFDWVLYVFGAFLVFTGVRIARHSGSEVHPEKNPVLRLVRRVVPTTDRYHGQKLFTRESGRRVATPLFTVLVLVEATDVVFAVDSVPAVLAVSREPFIVFAANAFAILGLRSLYFLLAGMADRFRYLNIGLGVIMGFVGIKMIVAEWYHFPIWASLAVISVVLTVAIWLSIRADASDAGEAAEDETPDRDHPGSSAKAGLRGR
ncbi:MAG: TerC family protein [Actinomycetota bacterium]|nr:TerC family protein [Actinomycetota bacterium]MDP9020269.1 TerC family protein [Actinomycetota bacterium]